MATDLRLEAYLHSLDKALGPIPISQRAEFIMEIKNHILAAQKGDSSQSMDQILAALGQPEIVATRFLLEKGLKPISPARSPIIKWLVIGFLGTLGILTLFVTILIFKFSPLIEVSEKDGRVKIFGGTIDINDFDGDDFANWNGGGHFANKKGQFKFKVDTANSGGNSIEGTRQIDSSSIDKIFIPFSNGKFEIRYNRQKKFSWDCKTSEGSDSFSMATEQNRVLTLNLNRTKGVRCELNLPEEVLFAISGANGDLAIDSPHGPMDIQLANGRVVIEPDRAKSYNYDLKVLNGKADEFESTNAANAIKIKVEIKNGYVQKG